MEFRITRRVLLLGGLAGLGGCSAWDKLTMRSQSPEEPEEEKLNVRTVGDLAVPFNMQPIAIENIGLVTGLKGTGSDPKPSSQRSALLAEMRIREVSHPDALLATGNTSLVVVRGIIRPGIQEGDRFDVEVRVGPQSETTSLRGGHLLETRLKETALNDDNLIRNGHTGGIATGAVLVDPSADSKKDRVAANRGWILGGGVATKSRPLGLVLPKEHQSAFETYRIQEAINKRFHTFDKGSTKTGVAKAFDDKYIELKLHPRYKDNVHRYIAVIRSVAIKESEADRSQRLKQLEKRLFDPISASRAALQLEAIGGKQASEVLLKGLQAGDPEVRFYAAEALAYLDDTKAAEPLGQAVRDVPAFRVFALSALSAMDDYAAAEQLRQLLHMASAETRYGAFRALWAMNPNEPAIRGEMLGGQFSYHVLDTTAPPMIHVTRSRRAEVVLFGRDQRLKAPILLEAGNHILVNGRSDDQVVVSKFSADEADQKRIVSNRIDDILRAIVELGGTYPDVVQALQQAKTSGALTCRFEVDALPEGGRRYDRIAKGEGKGDAKGDAKGEKSEEKSPTLNSPMPDLYTHAGDAKQRHDDPKPASETKDVKNDEPEEKKPGFFTRLWGGSDS
jgi:flagellar basal body P-ring protein FlgI